MYACVCVGVYLCAAREAKYMQNSNNSKGQKGEECVAFFFCLFAFLHLVTFRVISGIAKEEGYLLLISFAFLFRYFSVCLFVSLLSFWLVLFLSCFRFNQKRK
jgi:hypothetical protein